MDQCAVYILYSKIPTDPGVLKIRHSHRLYIFLISFVHQGYNWSDLIETGKLSKLKVKELDEYLKEHQLPSAGKKPDKLKRITADFYLRNNKEATSEERSADPESDSVWESDSDDDDVLAVIGDSDTDEDPTVEPLQTTAIVTPKNTLQLSQLRPTETETCQFFRSGRSVGHG